MNHRRKLNPLAVLVGKQLVGQEDTDAVSMPVLTCLDAAKRGLATNGQANTLAQHLLTAQAIWARMGNQSLYTESIAAWNALGKACRRPTQTVDLTTGEYAAIRAAISHYLRALPKIEIALYSYSTTIARAEMEKP